jgi:hypothetical protein
VRKGPSVLLRWGVCVQTGGEGAPGLCARRPAAFAHATEHPCIPSIIHHTYHICFYTSCAQNVNVCAPHLTTQHTTHNTHNTTHHALYNNVTT